MMYIISGTADWDIITSPTSTWSFYIVYIKKEDKNVKRQNK